MSRDFKMYFLSKLRFQNLNNYDISELINDRVSKNTKVMDKNNFALFCNYIKDKNYIL